MLSKVPRNVDLVIQRGDLIRVYRETKKKYLGPYPVSRVDGTQVFVIIKGHEVQHSLDQVVLASDYENLINGDAYIDELFNSAKKFRSPKPKSEDPPEILITEIIHLRDPRNRCDDAVSAKRKEIESLFNMELGKLLSKRMFLRTRT